MNKQTLLILTGGFFTVVLSVILIQVMLGKGSGRDDELAQGPALVEILVANEPLEKGDKLDEYSMRWQEWPEYAVFDGAIIREGEQEVTEALKGMLSRDVTEGEPLMQSALVAEADNFLAATLKDGKRAVAIKVDEDTSVAGFVNPGDHVDIIMTYNVRLPRDRNIQESATTVVSKSASQTILENIRVLATDQETRKNGDARLARTVTVEVSTSEAEVLALASNMGKLSLSLRKLGDDSIMAGTDDEIRATTDIRISKVMQEMLGQASAASVPTEVNQNNAGTGRRIMRLYNGSNSTDIPVRTAVSY